MKNSVAKLVDDSIIEKVHSLYELMKSEKLEELEIKEEDFYLLIKRKGKKGAVQHTAVGSATGQSITNALFEEENREKGTMPPAGDEIRSPINGIFYRSPSPSSPPFVKEGDVVDSSKTLCIVEAMKVMNEIKAGSKVKILKILVENGKPVTAEQLLFLVEKV